MSGLLMGRAFYFDLPPRQKLLLLAIADHANDDGYGCHPSQVRLAEKVGCTRRHIHNLLKELESQGLIEVLETGDGAGLNTHYCLPWAKEVQIGKGGSIKRKAEVQSSHEPSQEPPSSSSEELRSSSSSPDEEEDRNLFRDKLTDWYRTVSQKHHGLRSPLKAPAKYFSKVSQNGDSPDQFSISAATLTCLRIWEAFTLDWAEGKPHRKDVYTVPMPGELRGLCEVGQALIKWLPSRATIRHTLFDFVKYDDENLEPEIEPNHLLGRIARHPEKFVTALENLTREP